MIKERNGERTGTQGGDTQLSVRWDDSNMRSQYSNVCNVTGTREEIVLLFGVNQAWHGAVKELTVQLQERMILNPYAAKRLNLRLSRVLREYEASYGAMHIEATAQAGLGESLPAGVAVASS